MFCLSGLWWVVLWHLVDADADTGKVPAKMKKSQHKNGFRTIVKGVALEGRRRNGRSSSEEKLALVKSDASLGLQRVEFVMRWDIIRKNKFKIINNR